jgi:hypothetical protein
VFRDATCEKDHIILKEDVQQRDSRVGDSDIRDEEEMGHLAMSSLIRRNHR